MTKPCSLCGALFSGDACLLCIEPAPKTAEELVDQLEFLMPGLNPGLRPEIYRAEVDAMKAFGLRVVQRTLVWAATRSIEEIYAITKAAQEAE